MVQILIGLTVVVLDINKIYPLFEQSVPTSAMHSTFMLVIDIIKFVYGLALLTVKYIPLVLTILLAIMIRATMSHNFYDSDKILGSVIFLNLYLVLFFEYKYRFKYLLIT